MKNYRHPISTFSTWSHLRIRKWLKFDLQEASGIEGIQTGPYSLEKAYIIRCVLHFKL